MAEIVVQVGELDGPGHWIGQQPLDVLLVGFAVPSREQVERSDHPHGLCDLAQIVQRAVGVFEDVM